MSKNISLKCDGTHTYGPQVTLADRDYPQYGIESALNHMILQTDISVRTNSKIRPRF